MKIRALVLSLAVVSTVFTGCAKQAAPTPVPTTPAPAATTPAKTDTVTGASMATDEASFEQKIGKSGVVVVLTNKDLTFTKDITVDGTFTKKDKTGKEVVARSLGLATETADKKVDKRFTVAAPKIVINSENTLLEFGTLKGDVYVQAKGFTTKDATIDGNLYFATEELKNAFKADATTKITGKVEVKAYTK
ncbi:hypothetical protein [Candidatus Clostridium radicumherbarum]|uniref:Lipoprotein n=1 Tax=Candidatus Clostridium radicumherbarum TaxID=3381662 RepID=A0ABW8TNQ8_9CLOT